MVGGRKYDRPREREKEMSCIGRERKGEGDV